MAYKIVPLIPLLWERVRALRIITDDIYAALATFLALKERPLILASPAMIRANSSDVVTQANDAITQLTK